MERLNKPQKNNQKKVKLLIIAFITYGLFLSFLAAYFYFTSGIVFKLQAILAAIPMGFILWAISSCIRSRQKMLSTIIRLYVVFAGCISLFSAFTAIKMGAFNW